MGLWPAPCRALSWPNDALESAVSSIVTLVVTHSVTRAWPRAPPGLEDGRQERCCFTNGALDGILAVEAGVDELDENFGQRFPRPLGVFTATWHDHIERGEHRRDRRDHGSAVPTATSSNTSATYAANAVPSKVSRTAASSADSPGLVFPARICQESRPSSMTRWISRTLPSSTMIAAATGEESLLLALPTFRTFRRWCR